MKGKDMAIVNPVHERINGDIGGNDVVLYMKGSPVFPQCGFSAAVVQILSMLEVKFKGIDVLVDPALRDGGKQFSDWPTIPQLYVKGEFVGGCDIITEMASSGELYSTLGVEVPDVAERNYDDLSLIVYGSSPIAAQTLRDALAVFNCDFIQAYGMTETTAVASLLQPDDHRRALGGEEKLLLSAGRAVLGTSIRIVDEDDREVLRGTIGEVAIRGPQLMKGYWNRPDATAESMRGGWMHTGDAGILDDDGFLYIQDRVKDMIVSGGENIYPREIEDVLFEFPGVADAAVFGVPDEKFGEAVKAVIVVKDGEDVSVAALLTHCRERLARYKQPRSVDFIDELPRNPSDKVLKKDLHEPFWRGHDRRVG